MYMHEQKACCICHESFIPHPRLKDRQKTCAAASCRRELKKRTNKDWRAQNSDYFRERYETTLKAWHEKNRDYKKKYRQERPEYVQKNLLYLKAHRRRACGRLMKEV
jgi:hypothetical protein